MNELNMLAVFAATVASFIFGALWYSPLLFLPAWCKETGLDPSKNIANPGRVYGVTFVLTLLAAISLAWVLGTSRDPVIGSATGALMGMGLVATSIGINYQFAGRSIILWAIDGGFHIFRLTLMGLIIGLWP
ncbi:DUF1761 domain-containing protein [Motiliproteus sp. MSK22-1]|uniref:DUF1761 domain-containing protein n=1 Tax=Motiliproteus sp. MSK22-1 TaxID=1897630 RepID=UPI000975CA88|nr:DUF1761 domain-containing protein [Motiliproteus sp. MSK22-1]OMH25851.1 hypothetical protein BGP75_25390 [Motiliproteus sp. MSK22-1]